MVTEQLRFVLDLALAALLSGVIGVQRQATHKPAGLRTHVLVGVGSCAFMEVSRLVGDSRIAAGVITGIGFLGAGAIVRTGFSAHGLTTAASIWAASAVGLALGLGTTASLQLAALTTAFTFVTLILSDQRVSEIFPQRGAVVVSVTYFAQECDVAKLVALMRDGTIRAKPALPLKSERSGERLVVTATFNLLAASMEEFPGLAERLQRVPGVEAVVFSSEAAT